jgi:DNA-binding MarR family transcriptional regulator
MPGSRFTRAEDSPGFLLWQLTNLWQQTMRATLAPLGVTHVQFVLLASIAWLARMERSVTQALLARHAHTDVMMTSQVLRTLEEKGLVTRVAHPTDTRAKVVTLTDAGYAIAIRAVTAVEDADDRFFHTLGAQVPELTALMRQVIRAHARE